MKRHIIFIAIILSMQATAVYGDRQTAPKVVPDGSSNEPEARVHATKESAESLRWRLSEGLWQAIVALDSPTNEQILQTRANYMRQHREEYAQLRILERSQIQRNQLHKITQKALRGEISQTELSVAIQRSQQINEAILQEEADAVIDRHIEALEQAVEAQKAK